MENGIYLIKVGRGVIQGLCPSGVKLEEQTKSIHYRPMHGYTKPNILLCSRTYLIDLSYFAEYLTFRKSKGIYYTLKESGGTTYFVLDHVLNLSLHGDDKKDTEV